MVGKETIAVSSLNRRISLHSYFSFTVEHPKWVLLVLAFVALVAGWHLPRLSFKTSIYDMIIEDLPEARRYQEFRELFGSDEIIQLVVRADNVFEPATFARITQLSEACAAIPGVRRILSLPEVKKSVDRAGRWDMHQFAAMLAPVALFDRNLISSDHRSSTVISLVLASDSERSSVVAAVDDLIRGSGKDLNLFQTGMPLVSEALSAYSRQDFMRFIPVTLLVIALLLVLLYGNFFCVILPLSAVLLSMIWTFGAMAACGVAISMLNTILPVFLIAVGTAYNTHVCSEYLSQLKDKPNPRAAVRATFSGLSLPLALVVLTTVIGIGSLVTSRITAIREYALFSVLGVLCLFLIVMTFLPSIMVLLPLPKIPETRRAPLDRFCCRVLEVFIQVNQKYQKPSFMALAGLSLFLMACISMVRVETNPVSFFKENTKVRHDFNEIYQNMSGSFPINVVLSSSSEDFFAQPSNMAILTEFQQFLDKLPGIDKTISFADYLQLVNYSYNQYDPQFYVLPQEPYEMRLLMNTFKILLGNDLLQRFLSMDYSQVNILLLTHVSSSRDFLRTRDLILEHAGNSLKGLRVEVTGLGTVIAASSHLVTWGQVKSLGWSLALILAVMIALFVSSKVGLIAILPNLFPIAVNFGVMGLFGIPLSSATSLISGVVIGLAVDETIHYLVRYNSEFKKDLDKDRAMRETLMSVGRPMIYTSLTIGLGFAVLIFSHFHPTSVFGWLMVITMAAALIGDLFLLPALMMHVELVTAWDLLKMIPTAGAISPAFLHEINQPLNAIKVGNDFLRMTLQQRRSIPEKHLDAVTAEIGAQVRRASGMIQRLAEMSQTPSFDKIELDVNEPVSGTLGLLENQFRLDNIRLDIDLDSNLPPILGNPNRLAQAFYNICENAREAIQLRRSGPDDADEHILRIRTCRAKQSIQVIIADTGIGIAEHCRDRIFEPFFSTKAQGQGRGLGLSISNQIVRDCGGRISGSSAPGQGTVVTISFPPARPKT